jgi:TolB protein
MNSERYSRTKLATRRATFILIILFVSIIVWIIASLIKNNPSETTNQTSEVEIISTDEIIDPTPEATNTPLFPTATSGPEIILVTATPSADKVSIIPGMMIFSISEEGYFHLFAYHPELLPLTRLTNGDWDDKDPAISPDGTRIVFSSHQSGQWDIFILDLETGEMTQLTDSRDFDGAPAWSPDGKWLVYESYVDGNMDIYLQTADLSLEAVRVTYDSGLDFSPAWNKNGTLLAFTTNRTGNLDIWLADISVLGQQEYLVPFTSNKYDQSQAIWDASGSYFTWVSNHLGENNIMLSTVELGEDSALVVGSGEFARWNPDGGQLLVDQKINDLDYIAILNTVETQPGYTLLPQALDGVFGGMDWRYTSNPKNWNSSFTDISNQIFNEKYSLPYAQPKSSSPTLLQVNDLLAPNPSLSSNAFEAFLDFWNRADDELRWDILSDLDQAYTPLYIAPDPGMLQDWSYTGCSVKLVSSLYDLGWLEIVREDRQGYVYWRLFAKAYIQDGSVGEPMLERPWDFSARYSFEGSTYEDGGAVADQIPGGYWVDFTELALRYGWTRLPAISTWREFSQAARWNEFVFASGLDWESAMLLIYSQDELDGFLGN